MPRPRTRRRPSRSESGKGALRYVRTWRSSNDHDATVSEKVLVAVFFDESLISMVNE